MTRSLLALLVTLTACASSASDAHVADSDRDTARELAFTHTYEIRFGQDTPIVGYLVEFYEVPQGILDGRAHPPGTYLLQDLDLLTIGFITPSGHAYVFDELGSTVDMGFAGRDQHVSTFFGRSERPRYRSIRTGAAEPGKERTKADATAARAGGR